MRVLISALGIMVAVIHSASSGEQRVMADARQQALNGDIEAQRQLAASASPAVACAWRIVIVASGDPRVTIGDSEARRRDCESLDPADQAAAVTEAKAIFQQIYGRELVLPADFFGHNPWPARR